MAVKDVFTHTVGRNAIALGVMQIANYLVPLLMLPYLTRVLGMEGFGVVAMALAACHLAYVVTDYGFSLSATYEISRSRADKSKIDALLSAVFGAKTFLVLFSCTALLVFPMLLGEDEHFIYFAASIFAVMAQAFQPVWYFQGMEKMKSVTVYMVLTKIIYALLILCLVKEEDDGIWVVVSWGVAQASGTAISLTLVIQAGHKIRIPALKDSLNQLKNGAQFFWSRVAVALYTSASTLIVGFFGGPIQAAGYAACEQIYRAGQNVTSPINQALYPHMARDKNWPLFKRLLLICVVVLVVGCSVMALFSESLLITVFGEEYRGAAPVLNVFLLMTVITYLGVSFGYPAYAAIGRVDVANYSVIAGAVFHGLALFALYWLGTINALNVALAILFTETFVTTLRMIGLWLLCNAQKNT